MALFLCKRTCQVLCDVRSGTDNAHSHEQVNFFLIFEACTKSILCTKGKKSATRFKKKQGWVLWENFIL